MFSVPLRRALVVGGDLPYPEGRAAAEVLKVGSASRDAAGGGEAKAGLWAVLVPNLLYAVVGVVAGGLVLAGVKLVQRLRGKSAAH